MRWEALIPGPLNYLELNMKIAKLFGCIICTAVIVMANNDNRDLEKQKFFGFNLHNEQFFTTTIQQYKKNKH